MKHRHKKRHIEEGREHETMLPLSPLKSRQLSVERDTSPVGKGEWSQHQTLQWTPALICPNTRTTPKGCWLLVGSSETSPQPTLPKCQPVHEAPGHSRPTISPHEPRLQVGTCKPDSQVCSLPGQLLQTKSFYLPGTRPAPVAPASRPAPRTSGSKTILVPDWPPQTQSPCQPPKPQAPEWLPKPEVWGSSHGRKE